LDRRIILTPPYVNAPSIPEEVEQELKELKAGGRKDVTINVPTKARIEKDVGLAGFRLTKMMEGFLEKDNIFILSILGSDQNK
jgi:hypothetical protein